MANIVNKYYKHTRAPLNFINIIGSPAKLLVSQYN